MRRNSQQGLVGNRNRLKGVFAVSGKQLRESQLVVKHLRVSRAPDEFRNIKVEECNAEKADPIHCLPCQQLTDYAREACYDLLARPFLREPVWQRRTLSW